MIARVNLERRKAQMERAREFRRECAVMIQKVYRGHRGRTYYKIKAVEHLRKLRKFAKSATQITRIVRGYNARHLLQRMKRDRYNGWVAYAKQWKETWSTEADTWYHITNRYFYYVNN